MRENNSIQVRYRFERGPKAVHSDLTEFARTAEAVVRDTPWLVPELPFARAAQVSGGLLHAQLGSSSSRPDLGEPVRLRAIETSTVTLLENSYDNVGRLVATVYPDGVRARYQWGAAGQLSRVDWSPNAGISYQYGRYGLLESVTYPGGNQFRYEYGAGGKLFKCEYPDRRSVWRKYDRQGRLAEVTAGQAGFGYEWDKNGELTRVIVRFRSETRELAAYMRQVTTQPIADHDGKTGDQQVVSEFGAWVYAADGRLREMSLADGERLCLRVGNTRAAEHVWNAQGQTTYGYDNAGVLAAVIRPNGARSVYHRAPSGRVVWMVHPSGVTLLEYDRQGNLAKLREDNGAYAVFRHDRHGQVCRVETAQGALRLHHGGNDKLERLKFPHGLSATVAHGTGCCPSEVAVRGLDPDAFSSAVLFARGWWEWIALKSTLRLVDQNMKEA